MTGCNSLPATLPAGSSSKAQERDVASAPARYRVAPGLPLPLGVQDCCDGFNFAVFSRHAERVELRLFDDTTATEPALVVDLDPVHHRTGDIWHTLVDGVRWDRPMPTGCMAGGRRKRGTGSTGTTFCSIHTRSPSPPSMRPAKLATQQ